MQLGIRSIIYSRNHSWRDTPVLLKRDGFAGVQIGQIYQDLPEIASQHPRMDPGAFPPDLANRIRDAFVEQGLEVWCMDCYNNLGAADDEARRNAIGRMMGGIRICQEFGCRAVVTEAGTRGVNAFERAAQSLQEVMPCAEANGVLVCIEPSYKQSVPNSYTMAGLIEAVGSANLKVMLDAANILVYDALDRMFEVLGEHVVFCHAKDCNVDAKGDPSFPSAGQGMVDYHRFVELILEHGSPPLIIEYAREESIARVRDFLLGVIAEVEGNA